MKILKQVRENELVFKNRMIYGNSIAAECHNNNNTVNPSGVKPINNNTGGFAPGYAQLSPFGLCV
jgi:hypothetical protein